MSDLVLRPCSALQVGGPPRWALQLRWAHCGGTEYVTIARVEEDVAREIIAAGSAYWLFGDPRDDKTYKLAAMPDLSQFAPTKLTTSALELIIARLTIERDEARNALQDRRNLVLEEAARYHDSCGKDCLKDAQDNPKDQTELKRMAESHALHAAAIRFMKTS